MGSPEQDSVHVKKIRELLAECDDPRIVIQRVVTRVVGKMDPVVAYRLYQQAVLIQDLKQDDSDPITERIADPLNEGSKPQTPITGKRLRVI